MKDPTLKVVVKIQSAYLIFNFRDSMISHACKRSSGASSCMKTKKKKIPNSYLIKKLLEQIVILTVKKRIKCVFLERNLDRDAYISCIIFFDTIL